MSAAFASDLDAMVSKADLWVHGHIHDSMDYRLGKARVVCNWRGSPITIYAMTETRLLPAKTQRFIEFLQDRLRHLAAVSEH